MARITKGSNKTDEQTIDFAELRKGDWFKFVGGKQVYTSCDRVGKHKIHYTPHNDIWGGGMEKPRISKKQVIINFEY